MTTLDTVRQKNIDQMLLTNRILNNLLFTLTPEQATTLRDPDDGDKGWTIMDVLGHINDFDIYFMHRAEMMVNEDMPQLPAYDHEQIAIDHNYNARDLREVMVELATHRTDFVDFYRSLTAEQWERGGVHPERESFSMTDSCMQVYSHDLVHLEQITKILRAAA